MLPAPFEAIAPLDPANPLRALSLPQWVQNSLGALTAGYMSPTIPADFVFTEQQRSALERRIEDIDLAEMASDVDLTMAVVVELLEGFGGPRLSEDQARLRAKAYITALEGLPTWCVAEARRLYLRAEAGPQNYDFAPSPPRLAEIAKLALARLRAQRCELQRLLRAKPDRVTEHNPKIAKGFADLLADLKARARL
jgi:hypothetical protein